MFNTGKQVEVPSSQAEAGEVVARSLIQLDGGMDEDRNEDMAGLVPCYMALWGYSLQQQSGLDEEIPGAMAPLLSRKHFVVQLVKHWTVQEMEHGESQSAEVLAKTCLESVGALAIRWLHCWLVSVL